jgi:tRNA-binding protein
VEELTNKQIIAVINFEKKNIAGIESEVLVLGAVNKDNTITLISADQNLENGLSIS